VVEVDILHTMNFTEISRSSGINRAYSCYRWNHNWWAVSYL